MTDTAAGSGTLWIVATPIGTIGDFPARAREVLTDVAMILAEDTRRTGKLLSRVGVGAGGRMRSLHDHNEQRVVPVVLKLLQDGGSAALLSDAGTPVLSDPGFVLVREARRQGVRVLSVPGPSAFTAALAAAGQPPLPATLVGFLPPRSGPRGRRIAELGQVPWTLVILLSPHRLANELEALAAGLGTQRPATLLAELSKVHERAIMGELGELAASCEALNPRGEYVLVVGPADKSAGTGTAATEEIRAAYQQALEAGLDRSGAIKQCARRLGLPRRKVYEALITDKNQ